MNDRMHSEAVDAMFDAILSLKDREECYDFFKDLATVKEVQSLAQRYEVAALLTQGHTYQYIAKKTGASTATISRVNRSITDGSGIYEVVFERAGIPVDWKNDDIS